ncbi:oligoribonuclease [Salinibius halmophilus]|uniref:oligoribonuclease n=1 Tax=Salinibius halmophilus TaxID=1853216 RepID=UPI000E665C01|nr:oligoribonuclease [Salinibius halmophilus]
MNKETNLIWLDMEMTGLEPERDHIIEVATLVTDEQLNVLAEGPVIAIHQPDSVLALMDDWNQKTHGESGLVERVKHSNVSLTQAEQQTLDFLKEWVAPGCSPLCGNSIGQDRRFIYRYMPQLANFLHYRSIDVSTIKELTRRWAPDVLKGFEKTGTHKAMDDIKESLAELKYYREHVIKV